MKMDAAYFIAKFEAIPDERWIVGKFREGKGRCAFGHCGMHTARDGGEVATGESNALASVLGDECDVAEINDGLDGRYKQKTPAPASSPPSATRRKRAANGQPQQAYELDRLDSLHRHPDGDSDCLADSGRD